MKQYGVMLIGCGHIGCEHLAGIYCRENIRIEAVIDRNAETARLAARQYAARQYGTDYRPFLADPAVDIVIIATYVASHLTILKDCLAHGKHVLCEKPIASSIEEGRAFYEAVKRASSQVLIAHILRHNQSYIRMQQMIAQGAIGELRLMRMVQNHHTMNWGRYRRLLEDCPPIVDCGVHYIDVMQWFSGSRVCQVSGIGTYLEPDSRHPNYGMITLKLENGCIGYYEAGWSRNTASANVKEFIGTKGRITLTMRDHRSQNQEEGDLISLYHSDTGIYETINLQTAYKDMYAQISTLIDMIEHQTPGNPTIEEVYSAFCVAMEADRAIREGTILTLKPPVF